MGRPFFEAEHRHLKAAPRRRLRRPQTTLLLQSWKAPRWIRIVVVFFVVAVLLVEGGAATAPWNASFSTSKRSEEDVAPRGLEHSNVVPPRLHRRAGFSTEESIDVGLVVDPRIIGGTPTDGQEYPFFVQADTDESGFYCGASLIAPDVVLTAAHCAGMY